MVAVIHERKTEFANITWRDAPLRIEYQWVGVRNSAYPPVIFLHEGLGSVGLWNDFPEKFCIPNGLTGLVFSRYGYGQSTARPKDDLLPVTFMHAQAYEVLPAFFSKLNIEKPWLFGHSDGGSIALLYASKFPDAVSGIVVAAPHIFVEDVTVANIEEARRAYLTTDLRTKLGKYHADPDSAFWGWNDIWLDPAFRHWNIVDQLGFITCPVLAVQGENDEYGTLEQINGIKKQVPHARLLVLPKCGHSPHRNQPETLIKEAAQFIINRSRRD